MLNIDLTGKRAFVAGVADDGGFGFAIAKALAQAGASITLGTWPPAMGIFENLIERGKIADSLRLADGTSMSFERIYPLDAGFDTLEDAPAEIRENKRYRDRGDFSIKGVADRLMADFGPQPVDIVIHSLANGPEVKTALIDTSRRGYLEAVNVSAYSNISIVRTFGPLMREGGSFLSLSFLAGERAVPGYGGGMSSAKAALESDTRTLAFEAGRRWGVRVNTISAGPLASRAATAIGFIDYMMHYYRINSPIQRDLEASDVGHTAAFLASPLATGITGTTVYVDNGYHGMAMAFETPGFSPRSD
ncbi:MAG TPA: enoyl-[acyl-carrier-protein] reductase [Gemmatimonadales bacterium]|nr:enoyl-[acyl-carrier-protein] reductase [Gemmatimonadales bacterium]